MEKDIKYLEKENIKDFKVGIDGHGYLLWKVELTDNMIYQIKFRIEQHITPKGNKSKRKIYFISKDNKELRFTDEINKWFMAFRRPYIVGGI